MLKHIVALSLLLIVPATSWAQMARELIGKYQLEVQNGDLLELRADGSASMAGEETRWSVSGKQLSIGTDVMNYELQGGRLVVMVGPIRLSWKKIAGAVKAPSPMEKIARGASGTAPAGSAQDVQARQVLTNSAWCSFTYSKSSGTTSTRKVVFRPDGVMTVNGGSELYSSGYAGTYASQSNNASTMQWKLENMRLYVDQGGGAGFEDIGLTATKNSNGSVILHAAGREYAMCR